MPLVVLPKQVVSKIVFQVSYDEVNVVGSVLRVVVLYEEVRCLDAVVVPLPRLERTGPCKVNLAEADSFEMIDPFLGQIGAVVAELFPD